jgi:chromosome segregation ATPase
VKYLNYLVVENQETSKICSEYMKSKEISSDVLVLSNIPEKEQGCGHF